MNYKKLAFFIVSILVFLPCIAIADMSGGLIILGIIFLFPFVIIFSIFIILFQNYLIAYIPVKYYYKMQIKDKFKFFVFILKYSFVVGFIEIILIPTIFLITMRIIPSLLLSTAIYSILSGIVIFFIFRRFFPKELEMKKDQINNCAFLVSMLTNPLIGLLLIFYLLPLTFKALFL